MFTRSDNSTSFTTVLEFSVAPQTSKWILDLPEHALQDLHVLDLSQGVTGSVCTKVLADFGAEVIKVEKPGSGDKCRASIPFIGDVPNMEESGFFLYLNNNKLSVTLDLCSKAGANILLELSSWADLIVENFRPSFLPSIGLDYATLKLKDSKVVVTSITNFGQTGPYREFEATEATYYAMSGLMSATGLKDREPVKLGSNLIQFQAGIMGAFHSMVALNLAEISGKGNHVDISIHEVQTGSIDRNTAMLMAYQYAGFRTPRETPKLGAGSMHMCKDGLINLFPQSNNVLKALDMVGLPELKTDSRFATAEARSHPDNLEQFDAILTSWLIDHSVLDAWAAAQKAHILSGPVLTPDQVFSDPNFRARAFWPTIETKANNVTKLPGKPFELYDSPWSLRRPAPNLGQHNVEVFCGLLGYSRQEISKLGQMGVI